jgi:para-aminobenzoate synthetase component 1
LTQRFSAPFSGDAFDLYQTLRQLSPAPYSGWLNLPDVAIASSSPECFLRMDSNRWVTTRPIKGTRPRSLDAQLDACLASELAASAKDRAENVMIVDLMRNDLSKVCELESVSVPELFRVESYATVHHLVSTVRGRLRADCDVIDLVRACFPPGSMTGAPKLAAMQLLDRLEPVRRGVYSGALGYFDLRGGCDLAVVIRTLLVAGGRAWLHAGGGVVADSQADAEYAESLAKARAMLGAIALCQS